MSDIEALKDKLESERREHYREAERRKLQAEMLDSFISDLIDIIKASKEPEP